MKTKIKNSRAYFMRRFDYLEPYLPTPRCRKYRYRNASAECEISVPYFTEQDAPVAFSYADYEGRVKEYRLHDGKLYARVFNSDFYCLNGKAKRWATTEELADHLDNNRLVHGEDYAIVYDKEKCIDILTHSDFGYAVMEAEGELCVMAGSGEPMYCIYTFGLGHNHGGTSLSVDEHYNGNISYKRYFNALHYNEAVQEALRIAAARGDNESFRRIQDGHQRINVLIPDAVHREPAQQHGDGDSFQNALESLTEKAGSAFEAGLLALCFTASQVS